MARVKQSMGIGTVQRVGLSLELYFLNFRDLESNARPPFYRLPFRNTERLLPRNDVNSSGCQSLLQHPIVLLASLVASQETSQLSAALDVCVRTPKFAVEQRYTTYLNSNEAGQLVRLLPPFLRRARVPHAHRAGRDVLSSGRETPLRGHHRDSGQHHHC